MVKMAETYFEEEAYEKAYILYLKYLTLFIEKVRNLMKLHCIHLLLMKNRICRYANIQNSKLCLMLKSPKS